MTQRTTQKPKPGQPCRVKKQLVPVGAEYGDDAEL